MSRGACGPRSCPSVDKVRGGLGAFRCVVATALLAILAGIAEARTGADGLVVYIQEEEVHRRARVDEDDRVNVLSHKDRDSSSQGGRLMSTMPKGPTEGAARTRAGARGR